MPDKPHKKLDAWLLSFEFAKEIYHNTEHFPATERFGLISQLRRAAVSIPTDIAEGAGRKSKKEFINFLSIALGSLSEIDTFLLLARDLKFINPEITEELFTRLNIIGKLIYGLMKSLGYNAVNI